MYVIIKEDKAHEIETKIHKLKACLGEIIDCFHDAKRISHMPEEYRHSGFDTRSESHYPMEDRIRMTADPYYPPRDGYHEPYRRDEDYRRDERFEDRRRGGRY